MFSRVRVAIRFFFVGLAVGMLLAPRAGIETRRLLRERADRLVNDLLEAASLSGVQSGSNVGTPARRASATRREASSSETAGAVVGGA